MVNTMDHSSKPKIQDINLNNLHFGLNSIELKPLGHKEITDNVFLYLIDWYIPTPMGAAFILQHFYMLNQQYKT